MRLFHCLVAVLLLSAHGAAAQTDEPFEIRTYEVPVAHQQAVESVLVIAVGAALGPESRRSVSSAGNGFIVVTAPRRIHADVERFLRDFQPAESVNLRTEYWIVQGDPGHSTPLAPQLEPIREVLASIDSSSGEMAYSLEEHVEILSRTGGSARPRGRGNAMATIPNGRISQNLDYVDEKITGSFSLNFGSNSGLQTEIAVTPGQFIVLGRTGVDQGPGSLFVIMRSRIAD